MGLALSYSFSVQTFTSKGQPFVFWFLHQYDTLPATEFKTRLITVLRFSDACAASQLVNHRKNVIHFQHRFSC